MSLPFLVAGAAVSCVTSCHAPTLVSHPKLGDGVRQELSAGRQVEVVVALSTEARAGQNDAGSTAAITSAQSAVLSTLDSAEFRLRQRYAAIPAFSGTLRTVRALDRLLSHSLVRRVDRDRGGTGSIPQTPPQRIDTSLSSRRNPAQ
jgi:hypothetical protein